jgi:hypothetical protein
MHFDIKNILKNNPNYTLKQAPRATTTCTPINFFCKKNIICKLIKLIFLLTIAHL